jgi:hypothetical protein
MNWLSRAFSMHHTGRYLKVIKEYGAIEVGNQTIDRLEQELLKM